MGCESSSLNINSHTEPQPPSKRTQKQYRKPAQKEQVISASFSITSQDQEMIEGVLRSHHLLFKAGHTAKDLINNHLSSFLAKAGCTIFKKGDPSHHFFIIRKGEVKISEMGEDVKQKNLKDGDCFGDLGIEQKALRSATVTAVVATQLFGIKNEDFMKVSLELSRQSHTQVFRQINNLPIFRHLSIQQKHKMAYFSHEVRFSEGETIFRKGQDSNCLYIIRIGTVKLQVPEKNPLIIKSRQCFGETCLGEEAGKRGAIAVCLQSTTLLSFNRLDIMRHLGSDLNQIEETNKLIWAIKHQKSFNLSSVVMEAMVELKEIKNFKDGEVILECGTPIKQFVIALQGGINDQPQLTVFNVEGLTTSFKILTQPLVKKGVGKVTFINIQALQDHFRRDITSLITPEHPQKRQEEIFLKIRKYLQKLQLSSLRVIEDLGNGQYGYTLRVRSEGNIQFALRVLEKSKVLLGTDQEALLNMGKIGYRLNHVLVAKQFRSQVDKQNVYFLNQFVEGQDLVNYLKRQGRLHLDLVRHFAACVISIMEYLHGMRMLWRELKAESFVIDQDGYLMLVDLLFIEQLQEETDCLLHITHATPEYLPPETLSRLTYSFQADFWALGVLLYKLFTGKYPYGDSLKTQKLISDSILQEIRTKELAIPGWLPINSKAFLKLLLNPVQAERSNLTFSRLKKSTFFCDYDWVALNRKKIKGIPYQPPIHHILSDPIPLTTYLEYQNFQDPKPSILDIWLKRDCS